MINTLSWICEGRIDNHQSKAVNGELVDDREHSGGGGKGLYAKQAGAFPNCTLRCKQTMSLLFIIHSLLTRKPKLNLYFPTH